jgi:hypothetical protein
VTDNDIGITGGCKFYQEIVTLILKKYADTHWQLEYKLLRHFPVTLLGAEQKSP